MPIGSRSRPQRPSLVEAVTLVNSSASAAKGRRSSVTPLEDSAHSYPRMSLSRSTTARPVQSQAICWPPPSTSSAPSSTAPDPTLMGGVVSTINSRCAGPSSERGHCTGVLPARSVGRTSTLYTPRCSKRRDSLISRLPSPLQPKASVCTIVCSAKSRDRAGGAPERLGKSTSKSTVAIAVSSEARLQCGVYTPLAPGPGLASANAVALLTQQPAQLWLGSRKRSWHVGGTPGACRWPQQVSRSPIQSSGASAFGWHGVVVTALQRSEEGMVAFRTSSPSCQSDAVAPSQPNPAASCSLSVCRPGVKQAWWV